MKQEVSIKEPLKTLAVMSTPFVMSVYLSITSESVYWYVTLITLIIIIYFSYKDKDKTRTICSFNEGIIYFHTIGRQLKIKEIDKVSVYKSKLPFLYIIKINSNAYDNDTLKIKLWNKQHVTLILQLFKGIKINQCVINGIKI